MREREGVWGRGGGVLLEHCSHLVAMATQPGCRSGWRALRQRESFCCCCCCRAKAEQQATAIKSEWSGRLGALAHVHRPRHLYARHTIDESRLINKRHNQKRVEGFGCACPRACTLVHAEQWSAGTYKGVCMRMLQMMWRW